MPETRDGRAVQIQTRAKPGMSIFIVFGTVDGAPCHWTATGGYRMDGAPDPRDIVNLAA